MNGFSVYKNISKTKKGVNYKAEDFYLKLLGAPNKTVNDMLISPPREKNNKEIYRQAKTLFELRELILKKLVNKGIIKSDSDQSKIDDYEESIAERTKLKRQKLDEIRVKERYTNNYLFKKYFTNYQSLSDIYNKLSNAEEIKIHDIRIKLIKSSLIHF